MKVIILSGGLGTRLSEETSVKPKPMVEIGENPIIWHIMKLYAHYGFSEFVICLGYKGYVIKEYFSNYFLHQADVTIDLKENKMDIHNCSAEPWKITLVNTGLHTMTGGRLKRVQKYVGNETFMLTYGDGIGNIDIKKLITFHKEHGKYATMTSVLPMARYGIPNVDESDTVLSFTEKPNENNTWVNGGFFVLEPQIFDYIKGDDVIWEKYPLNTLAKDGQLMTYKHNGLWKCMDTLRDKVELENMWNSGDASWQVWED